MQVGERYQAIGARRGRGWFLPRRFAVATMLFLLGAASAALALGHVLEATNTTEFCTSCHSMRTVTEEYRRTRHFQNVSGVRARCADCHVPREMLPKLRAKVVAAKDVFHEIVGTIGTPERFEARRAHLAQVVWDRMLATNSRECRNCHQVGAMDLDAQDSTARKKHRTAEAQGKTCIQCHKGVAHELPKEIASNMR